MLQLRSASLDSVFAFSALASASWRSILRLRNSASRSARDFAAGAEGPLPGAGSASAALHQLGFFDRSRRADLCIFLVAFGVHAFQYLAGGGTGHKHRRAANQKSSHVCVILISMPARPAWRVVFWSAPKLASSGHFVNDLRHLTHMADLAVYTDLRIIRFCEGSQDARGAKSPNLRRCPAASRTFPRSAARCQPENQADAHHQPQYSAGCPPRWTP